MAKDKSLKSKAISGVLWKGLERVLAQFVSALVSIILARILMPEDYSVVSVVTIFFAFCNVLISSGLNTALIQKKNPDVLDFSTIFISNMVLATILYTAMFFSAPAISRLYDKAILVPIIRVLSLMFFINGYKGIVSAKIMSDLKFRKFFFSTIIGTVISAVVGIVMALKGFGPWALVAQQMTNCFIDALVLTLTSRIKLKIQFSKERFSALFKFGWKIMLSAFIGVTYDQTKPLIVGIKFSTLDLAYYNKGKTYPNLIASIGNDTLASSLFPAMAKVQDDKERVLNMTRRFMQLSSFLVFPLMVGFLAMAEPFVKIVLTDKWLPIVPYLMIFCVSDMFKPIQTGNLQAIRAIGRSDIILKLEIIKKSSYALIILLFVLFTNSPILLALSGIVTSVLASMINSFPNRKLLGYSYGKQFADISLNFLTAALMGVGVYFMGYIPMNIYLLTVVRVLSGVIFYFGLNLLIRNKSLFYLFESVKSFFGKSKKVNTPKETEDNSKIEMDEDGRQASLEETEEKDEND